MPQTYIYRTRTTWVYLCFVLLVGGLATVSFYVSGRLQDTAISLVNTVAFAALLWIFVVGPKIVLNTEGLVVHNPFSTTRIGWLSVIDLTTRYSFTVITENRQFAAWAAPAPSRLRENRIRRSDFRGRGVNKVLVTPEVRDTRGESDTALALARRHSERALNTGTAIAGIQKNFNWVSLVTLIVSVTALVSNFYIH